MRYLLLALLLTSCGYESDCFDGCNGEEETPVPSPKYTATPIGTPIPAQCEVNAVEPTPSPSQLPSPTPSGPPTPPTVIKVIIYDVDIIYECKERSRHHGRHRH